MRCFIAVPVGAPALAAGQRLLDSLGASVPGVRWVRPDTLHVTVHFFGDISADEARRGLSVLAPLAHDIAPFAVSLDALGTFSSRGNARVLWLGSASATPHFTKLAQRCRSVLCASGFPVEDRPFRVHCTLGRPRQPWSEEGHSAWRAACQRRRPLGEFRASRLVLYESVSTAEATLYNECASLRFGAAALQI